MVHVKRIAGHYNEVTHEKGILFLMIRRWCLLKQKLYVVDLGQHTANQRMLPWTGKQASLTETSHAEEGTGRHWLVENRKIKGGN